ncbi:hypothetical protein C2R22_21625 (plasmid) [Salinigranum rubrum]|uniref:SRPBCC family protein n=1 Tax=Salinigranum rubrum TaxID=755307 RepID=A0A2I8VQK2_9EURY|nr:SRPBCC family protein [Salinigranum rubrum]AUV84176.1 hypothetical protein C2R22_21625 [Salinigranum rubrum]
MAYQPRVRVSQVIPSSAPAVWDAVREFDSIDEWHPVIEDCTIDEGKSPVQIGAVRDFTAGDRTVRERLEAHSDVDRYYQYSMEGEGGDKVDYLSELRIQPITETNESLATWTAHYDVVEDGDPEGEAEHLTKVFSGGLNTLRDQFSE